jgi:hypothetical protein
MRDDHGLKPCFDAFSSREPETTPLSKCGAGFRSKTLWLHVKWRTSARPANSPAIENTTDPSA